MYEPSASSTTPAISAGNLYMPIMGIHRTNLDATNNATPPTAAAQAMSTRTKSGITLKIHTS
jgi:hypothetical protein